MNSAHVRGDAELLFLGQTVVTAIPASGVVKLTVTDAFADYPAGVPPNGELEILGGGMELTASDNSGSISVVDAQCPIFDTNNPAPFDAFWLPLIPPTLNTLPKLATGKLHYVVASTPRFRIQELFNLDTNPVLNIIGQLTVSNSDAVNPHSVQLSFSLRRRVLRGER